MSGRTQSGTPGARRGPPLPPAQLHPSVALSASSSSSMRRVLVCKQLRAHGQVVMAAALLQGRCLQPAQAAPHCLLLMLLCPTGRKSRRMCEQPASWLQHGSQGKQEPNRASGRCYGRRWFVWVMCMTSACRVFCIIRRPAVRVECAAVSTL